MRRHLKGYGAPNSWSLQRKKIKYVARPNPGPHKLNESVTLNFILINLLKLARTRDEVKKILNQKKVLVDNIPRTEERFPAGLMDTISIPSVNLYFRLIYSNSSKFILHPIKKEEAELKPAKIIGKTILKKNKLQINLYDGKNILTDKKDYKVGDTLILQNHQIKKHIPLKEGASIYLTGGKYVGNSGKLKKIVKLNGLARDKVLITIGKETIETAKDYAFAVEGDITK